MEPPNKTKKLKIVLAVVCGAVVLFVCFGFFGYFGVKTMRRSHLRVAAREAYDAEDWRLAEKLLNQYVEQDRDSEEDFIRLAEVYRHLGNTDEEMLCWYRASTLNPLKPELWDNYLDSAMRARAFRTLFTALSHKLLSNAELSAKEKMLYLVCAVMTNRAKDADQYYRDMLAADPEAFGKDDLARYAEFLVKFDTLGEAERSRAIEEGMRSEDPFVHLESVLLYLTELKNSGKDAETILEEREALLKQAAELNRFAMTLHLADYYFSQLKFESVIEVAEPYLADIVNIPMAILYAESCVFVARPEKLIPLADRYYELGGKYSSLANYFRALYDFTQGAELNDELARRMHELGGAIQTDLANLIALQVALNNDNVETVGSALEAIMKNPPFYNIRERARSAVHLYLWNKVMSNPELARDPGPLVKLARIIFPLGDKDPFLMRIIVADLRNRDMLTGPIIQEQLDDFPYDPYLLEAAAEFELFDGNPEGALEYTERFYSLKDGNRSNTIDLLHMLALELAGRIDEAAKEYAALVDNNEMDRTILYRYFRFCIDHKRRAELSAMADRLDASAVPDLKALAPFFRAEALFLQEKPEEALALLETARTDQPEFALRAANMFFAHDKLDQALSRYQALLDKHPDKQLILANIAEVYLAKGMKAEALSLARQAWEADQDNAIGQFVYAKMLADDGRYQEAEKVLKMPSRQVELPDGMKTLWTDIMLHCVREDLENRQYTRAFERANQYLLFFPGDDTFQELKNRAEQERKKAQDSRESGQP